MTNVSRQRAACGVLLACAVALVPLAARALFWLPAYQERRVAKLSLAELDALARREPENAVALLAYGRNLNRIGRAAEALLPLERAAGLSPDDGRIREAWSLAQLAGGFTTGAFGQLTQFVRTNPASPDGHRALGRFYIAQRSYRRAIEELERATALAPQDPDAWSLLAGARRGLGENDPARNAVERALALRPDSAEDTLLLATLYRDGRREGEALAAFERAAALAPDDPVCLREWARALLKTGRSQDAARAEGLAGTLAARTPQDPDALALLGEARLASGKKESGLLALRDAAMRLPPGTAVSTLPENEPTQFLDPAPALAAAQACAALGRRDEARLWQARYARRQKLRDAWRALTDRVRNAPEQRTVYRELAAFLARRGDAAEVARNVARSQGQAIDAPPALAAAARLLVGAGYGEEAVAVARRAVLLGPRSPESYEALGDAQLAAGRGHEAAVAFAHAAGLAPGRQPEFRARLEAFHRRRAQSPTDAWRLCVEAERRERETLGLPVSRPDVENLLREAVRREPRNTDALRALLRLLYRRDARAEALPVAGALLAISPEDGLGLSLRAAILLETPGATPDFKALTLDLAQAIREDAPTEARDALGLLSLRRGDAREAVRLFRESAAAAPAGRTYARLAEACDALGDAKGAGEARLLGARWEALEREGVARLRAVAARPDDRAVYESALRSFQQAGQPARASALRDAWNRRHPTSKENSTRL